MPDRVAVMPIPIVERQIFAADLVAMAAAAYCRNQGIVE
jgi:hypothetical protein